MRAPAAWGIKGEFKHSLGTNSTKVARAIRDKYIIPAIAEANAVGAIEVLLQSLARANTNLKNHLKGFHIRLGDEDVVTLDDIFMQFIDYKKRSKAPETTLAAYRGSAEVFRRFGLSKKDVYDIHKQDLTYIRDRLLELPSGWMKIHDLNSPGCGERLSIKTINTHLQRFRTVWKWAINDGKITELANPASGVKADDKSVRKTKRPITLVECDLLMNMELSISKHFTANCWEYLPLIARYSGARLAEVCQLTVDDIQTHDGVLCMSINDYDKTLKTQQSCRIIPIADKLRPHIEELLRLIPKDQKELFPKRGDFKNKIGHYFSKAWCEKAKTVGKHCTFHGLRAYAITQMANGKVGEIDRRRITGHKDNETHAGYTADDLQRYKDAVDTIL